MNTLCGAAVGCSKAFYKRMNKNAALDFFATLCYYICMKKSADSLGLPVYPQIASLLYGRFSDPVCPAHICATLAAAYSGVEKSQVVRLFCDSIPFKVTNLGRRKG